MKKLRYGPEDIAKIRAEFLAGLDKKLEGVTATTAGKRLTYEYVLDTTLTGTDKISVIFDAETYLRMHLAVKAYNHEICAHLLVRKDHDDLGKVFYYIYDVLPYPQEVRTTYVESIDEEYGPWVINLDSETRRAMRGQMHSHVNMAVSESGVDTAYYSKFIEQVQDFYVFIIMNKSGDINIMVYDVEDNVLYERGDIYPEIYYRDLTGDDDRELWNKYIKQPATPVSPLATFSPVNKKKESESKKEYDKVSKNYDAGYGYGYGYRYGNDVPYFQRDPNYMRNMQEEF